MSRDSTRRKQESRVTVPAIPLTVARRCAKVNLMKDGIDISRLSPAECILLAEQLWEHARTHPEAIPVTAAQREELDRRLDALETGKMPPGETWEVVRDRLFSR